MSAYVNGTLEGVEGDQRGATDEEAGWFLALMSVGGNETVRTATAQAIRIVSEWLDQRDLLVSDLDRHIPGAVEEILRYRAPLRNIRRTFQHDDIILDIMWSVELEPEVEQWIDSLPVREFARVLAAVERLSERGNQLRGPVSRSLGEGLFELRIDVGRAQRRITYYFAERQRIVLLTVFRKQRQAERAEVRRARQAMRRCIAEGHTAEEDD